MGAWSRRRWLGASAAGTASLMGGGCESGSRRPPPGDPMVGALGPGALEGCTATVVDDIVARFESAQGKDGLEIAIDLHRAGVSPVVVSMAAVHAGLRGLSPEPGDIQHLTTASATAAMFGAMGGSVDAVVASAWAAEEMVRALDNHEGLDPIDEPALQTGAALEGFHTGIRQGDPELAQHAIVAVHRERGLDDAIQALLRWAPRYNGHVGHPTIFLMFGSRALRWCPEIDPEPGLQQMAHGLIGFDDSLTDELFEIEELAGQLQVDSEADHLDSDAVIEILARARNADGAGMRQTVVELLDSGVGPTSIFTGATLAAAELMHRYRAEAVGTALHCFDSVHAIHNCWGLAADASLRSALVLASCSWLPAFRDFSILRSPNTDEIWSMEIDGLAPTESSSGLDAALDVADERDRAASVLGWFDHPSRAFEFEDRLRDLVLQKSRTNPHEYKMSLALLEQLWAIDPGWRARTATATAAWGPVPRLSDGTAFLRVRHELEG